MLKLLEWAVPLFVSVLLIQIVSDMLYMRAMEGQPTSLGRSDNAKQRLPVHVIDREATAGSIIT
jgi:hypothetical protein